MSDLSKYDVKEAANALNVLLVTLEPTLMDHGRDLGSALKKLVRTDQKNEHALADWDAALRLPLEHLHAYDIWLQRVDPALTFSKEPRAHVAGLSHRLKLVTDASPHSKGMLRRLSTIARGVMKRRSAANLSGLDQLPEEPLTPTSPTTVMSMGLNDSSITGSTTLTTGAKAKQNMSFSGKDDTKSPSNSSEDTLETMMDPAVDEIAELAVKPRRSIFPRRSLDSARPLSGWFSDALSSSRHKELDQQSSAAAALPPAPRTAGAATTTASGVPIKHEPLPKRYSLFIEPDENDTFSVQSFVKELKLDSYLFDDIVVESPTHTGASTPSPPSPRPASSRLSTKSVRNDNDSILTIPSTHQNTEMTTVSYDINFSKDEDYNTSSSVDDTNEPGTPTTPTAMQTTTSTAAEARRTSSFKSTQSYRRTSSSSQSHMSPRQRQGRHQESIGGVVASTAKNLEASLASSSGSTLSKASSFESVQTKRSMTSSIAPASPATTLASNKDIGELDVASLPPLPPPTSTVTSPVTSPVAVSKALPMQQPYKPKSTGQLAPLRPKTPLTIATPAVPLSPLLSPLRSTPSSVASTPTSPSYPVVSKDLMALRRANMMAKAECLQMPRDIVPKNGVDQLRMTNVKQKAEKKPPVRSLISFWEQVSDPADL
ncbi:hypothetical protein BGW41_008151 [Actinomortierella wolfii]|nr:hypothetical protein BGW41_008151 [Actinomortierella wolfii]